MDEILDELCILPENRIDKPGKVTESDLPLFIQKQKTERINRINSMEEQEKEKYRGIERKLYNERVREDKRHNRISEAKVNSKENNRLKQQKKNYYRIGPNLKR